MNNATYEDFLARLKEERLRLGLSQDDIGRLLRMTQSHYSKAELEAGGLHIMNFSVSVTRMWMYFICSQDIASNL